jgi:hypothetical protein
VDEVKVREQLVTRFVEVLEQVHNPSSFRFYTALMEIAELHARKQKDYGTEHDPFANVRASEEFDIPAWVGAMLRGNDKVSRIKTYIRKGTLANEGVEDAFQDLATYSLIALVLFREAMDGEAESEEQP